MRELVVEIEGLEPGHPVTVALVADLTIGEDLERECKRTAAQYGYYAVLAEKAEARIKRSKLTFEMWKAETEDRIVADAGGAGKFKRVKDLTRELIKLPRYAAFVRRIIQHEEEAGIMKQVAKAFEHKKDLVQTCNANRRSEMKG